MPFEHELWVRYAECDLQGVVFNSHYLAYVDDTMTHWMRAVGWSYDQPVWDFMVRHAELDWSSSAAFGDLVRIVAVVEHWGTTSFRVHFALSVSERAVADVRVTYVGIEAATQQKAPVPDRFRALLSGA